MKELYFKHLVNRYKDRVYTFASYFLRDEEQAKDITQEALVRFWKHFEEIDARRAKAWLLRVTRNLCIDQYRRNQSRQQFFEHNKSKDMEALNHPQQSSNPSDDAHTAFMRTELWKAIERLPEIQRTIVILREIEGLSVKEIGQALQTPVNTVKVYLMRARISLRKDIKNVLNKEWAEVIHNE